MKYLGGKTRIAKQLVSVMQANAPNAEWYVEPFVGGFNVIQHVSGMKRWGNDKQPYLIALFRAIRKGWMPPDDISEEHYNHVKFNRHLYDPHYVGFVGYAGGFGGILFRGFSKNKIGTNYFKQTKNVLLKQAPKLSNVKMTCFSYEDLCIPDNSIIYCDPPYENTLQLYYTGSFNSAAFWDWAREMRKKHRVFISSYEAPSDFRAIWKQPIRLLAGEENQKKVLETLWI